MKRKRCSEENAESIRQVVIAKRYPFYFIYHLH